MGYLWRRLRFGNLGPGIWEGRGGKMVSAATLWSIELLQWKRGAWLPRLLEGAQPATEAALGA